MANNTIGWGQGATNNNIGWGRGYANDIGWGSIYTSTWTGDTDIIGDDTVPLFVARVETDGGYVEGFQCLINELNAFPDADAGRVIFDAFRVRVVTDAGYAEAKFCTVNEINSLI